MNSVMDMKSSKKICTTFIAICVIACVLLVTSGVFLGYWIGSSQNVPEETPRTGCAANPAYEYLVGSAAWQMSAEAHALMMQGFYIAEKNIDQIADFADRELNGYRWVEDNGEKKLYLNENRVCVVCDIDDI